MKPVRERSFFWRMLSPLAWPFVLLYAIVIRLKNAAYDLSLLKPRHLSWPVISVGNLSVGGTGKTPVVMLFAVLLRSRGWQVDVLSRGYGRNSQQVARVDSQGTPEIYGDEPLLIAHRGATVYVGADRYQSGLLAERESLAESNSPRGLHILDDGFQHRRLSRAIDIVLLQRADLADDMLPLGRLREPLCALERADICVLRAEDAGLTERVLRLMRQRDPARVWIVERQMTFPTQPVPKALAFCAIGDPHSFFAGLRSAAIKVEKEISFRDHHAYTQNDIDRLKSVARTCDAECFITTEKDAVRLTRDLRTDLEKEFPLVIAGLEVSLRNEVNAMVTLESLLAARLQVLPPNVR